MMTKISNKVVPVLFTFLIVPLRTLRGQFDTPTPAAKKAAICRSLYIPIIAEERERRDSVGREEWICINLNRVLVNVRIYAGVIRLTIHPLTDRILAAQGSRRKTHTCQPIIHALDGAEGSHRSMDGWHRLDGQTSQRLLAEFQPWQSSYQSRGSERNLCQ